MLFDRFDHVLRACRCESAIRSQQWTDRSLVKSDDRDQHARQYASKHKKLLIDSRSGRCRDLSADPDQIPHPGYQRDTSGNEESHGCFSVHDTRRLGSGASLHQLRAQNEAETLHRNRIGRRSPLVCPFCFCAFHGFE